VSNRHTPQRIVLVGLPGCGKTAVARQVAKRLGRPWHDVDTDDLIVSEDGRSIPEIFRRNGEAHFRQLEQQAIGRLQHSDNVVVATGGGAVLNTLNRQQLWRDALVVYLKARPETLIGRLQPDREGAGRPLLAGDDPLARLRALHREREPFYALADWTIQTDGLFPDQTAEEVARIHLHWGEQLTGRIGREAAWQTEAEQKRPDEAAARVTTPTASYPIYTGPGEIARLGERMATVGLRGRAFVVVDEALADRYGASVCAALTAAGIEAALLTTPGSEGEKHLGAVQRLYDALIAARAERGDTIVAVGGGVVTDLAGFVAATYLRGVPLVQVPTSLLGMVDAAIGGKTGVDHAHGKNLIGAFYQPRLVVADVEALRTLAPRELTAGWAEVIKHALILDPELYRVLGREADRVLALDTEAVTDVLRRSARIKASIVSGDERESGLRMTLNYGHTIGHAIEAASGYSAVLHGEAVAIGMQGAAAIAVRLGLLQSAVARQQQELLQRYGLPLRAPAVALDAVLQAMTLDKKVVAKRQRWVLLTEIGHTIIRDDVPVELAREVVSDLLSP
jgi:shikimate kinase / 3-dehydroquinate synthase